jgi:hypothetical protein
MKLSVQVGPYLLTIGFEPFDFVRIKSCGAWALFFGIGSLGYWPWTHGFRIRLGDWTESQALAEGKYTIELCLPDARLSTRHSTAEGLPSGAYDDG